MQLLVIFPASDERPPYEGALSAEQLLSAAASVPTLFASTSVGGLRSMPVCGDGVCHPGEVFVEHSPSGGASNGQHCWQDCDSPGGVAEHEGGFCHVGNTLRGLNMFEAREPVYAYQRRNDWTVRALHASVSHAAPATSCGYVNNSRVSSATCCSRFICHWLQLGRCAPPFHVFRLCQRPRVVTSVEEPRADAPAARARRGVPALAS